MNELSLDSFEILAGFRLQYLEVLNWGTFNQKVWRIDPNGFNSLLTGDIGSGKSTLVDAITTLLVPTQKITFNKAAGAEARERSLLTYIRGEYKKEKEEITKTARKINLRADENTYTVILANFYNAGYQEHLCLAQVFWIKENRAEKLLVSSESPLEISKHFSQFSEISELRKRLKQLPGVNLFDDNFTRYSEYFRHRFGMTSDKAIDLFYQTVSMKSVSSLTTFVREQMLEKTDVKEQIAVLLNRFNDLKKAHAAVVHAREQYNHLKPLVENAIQYGEALTRTGEIERMLQVVPAWLGEKKTALYQEAVAMTENELEMVQFTLQTIQKELKDLDDKRMGLRQDIDNNGGKRLEQIAREIAEGITAKQRKKEEWDNYQRLAQRSGLNPITNETDFLSNRQAGGVIIENCKQKATELREERDQLVIKLREKRNELEVEQRELDSLKARKSQVPAYLIEIRNMLCEDLQIPEDELPFSGEILKVNENDAEWEGAIERLLRDFGISLLVPSQHYKRVNGYMNANTLSSKDGKGRKLTYLETDLNRSDAYRKELHEDSLVYKVQIKPDNAFGNWMENHLHKNFGDFICVDIEDLPHVNFGLTRQGLIKSGKIRHTKDDRYSIADKRNYVLGWTNLEKIRALETNIHKLNLDFSLLDEKRKKTEAAEQDNRDTISVLTEIVQLKDFGIINWHYEAEKIYLLEKEQETLLAGNNQLNVLKSSLLEVENRIEEFKQKETRKNQEIGALTNQIENYKKEIALAHTAVNAVSPQDKEAFYPLIQKSFTGELFTLNNINGMYSEFKMKYEGEGGELKKLQAVLTRLSREITRKMRDIKEHSKAEYNELSDDIEARAEYIAKFERLAGEDLKKHEDRFKEELNRNVINSIAVFDTQLEKHEKDIRQKIKYINEHLHDIVYDAVKGTYITILIDTSQQKDIRQFKEELKRCYVNTLSVNGNLYGEEKYEQVKQILDRFASMENMDKEWTATVTDVRNWFEFNASERYAADNSEKEFYEGSGGKSGGQKEKLAYTILASALAYQFGLHFRDNKSKSFRFVVIDEAFGRGSDESTRYGLELFQKLNLQLLIVTPLQKIHIIENHVRAFHFISNKDGNNSQISNLTALEYKEEKEKRNRVGQPEKPLESNYD